MSDKIEIDVKINGKTAKLSDISDETLANMKKLEQPNPIKHGDYGICLGFDDPRLFVKVDGVIKAFDKNGAELSGNANLTQKNSTAGDFSWYTIIGNVFEDMEKPNCG